jgi:predicted transcriptional regulator
MASQGSPILIRVDRNRWDWIVVFADEDVPFNQITAAETGGMTGKIKRIIPVDVWVKHVMRIWNLEAEKIQLCEATIKLIGEKAEYLNATYNKYASTKPFSNELNKLLEKTAVAVATLTHSFEDGILKVKDFHVLWTVDFIESYLKQNLEISEALRVEEANNSDVVEVVNKLLSSDPKRKIFLQLVFNPGMKQATLVKRLNLQKSNVSNYVSDLKALGLIDEKTEITELGSTVYKQCKDTLVLGEKLYNRITPSDQSLSSYITLEQKREAWFNALIDLADELDSLPLELITQKGIENGLTTEETEAAITNLKNNGCLSEIAPKQFKLIIAEKRTG